MAKRYTIIDEYSMYDNKQNVRVQLFESYEVKSYQRIENLVDYLNKVDDGTVVPTPLR